MKRQNPCLRVVTWERGAGLRRDAELRKLRNPQFGTTDRSKHPHIVVYKTGDMRA